MSKTVRVLEEKTSTEKNLNDMDVGVSVSSGPALKTRPKHSEKQGASSDAGVQPGQASPGQPMLAKRAKHQGKADQDGTDVTEQALAPEASSAPRTDGALFAQATVEGNTAVSRDTGFEGVASAQVASTTTGLSEAHAEPDSATGTAPMLGAGGSGMAISGLAIGGMALGAGAGGSAAVPTAASTLYASGLITLGGAAAGLKVQALDKSGNVIAEAITDAQGKYTLKLDGKYAGQAITLSVTDPDKTDGKGYVDEATGESKDITTTMRAKLVLDGNASNEATPQQAQITPLTELAARQIDKAQAVGTLLTEAELVQATNKAVGQLFGLSDVVSTAPPNVVGDSGSGDQGDAYGQALALLSGMDAVAQNQGASDGTSATLDRLQNAITLDLRGSVSAQFNGADVDTLNLLSQAVAEVASGQSDTSLVDALSKVALNVANTAIGNNQLTVFISTPSNVLGAGQTAIVSWRFDQAPSAEQIAAFKAQLNVTGGTLSTPAVSSDPLLYTATLTQAGTSAPHIWLEDATGQGVKFFSNELLLQYDVSTPVLSIASMQGLNADGSAASILNAGDTVRITLSASESVRVTSSGTASAVLKLDIGGHTVDANYVDSRSSTKNLVFEYTLPSNSTLQDSDGIGVESLVLSDGVSLTDFAGNAARLNPGMLTLAPSVDTAAPMVVAQTPQTASVVGNAGVQNLTLTFNEPVQLGSGTLSLSRGASTVQTLQVGQGTVSADGQSVSFALAGTALTAGDYTVNASAGAFTDVAGNAFTDSLTVSGVWSFTVGAVSLGIDQLFDDNLLNKAESENPQGLGLTGSVSDPQGLLAGADMSALQVGFKPVAGGTPVWASVNTFDTTTGRWSATLTSANAALLQDGGYIVQAAIDSGGVKSNASHVMVVDRSARFGWASVAGDDVISTLEQGGAATGKSIALPFVAENRSSVNVTLTNANDSSKTLSLNATGTGVADSNSLKLTVAQLAVLGSGVINLSASVSDSAGNANVYAKTFSISDPTPRLQNIQLSGGAGILLPGDTVTALVTFDQAVAVNGSVQLNLRIGSADVLASYNGLSSDGRSLTFSTTIATGQIDGDGISVPQNPLVLASGASLKNAATGTQALTSFAGLADVDSLKVAASAPADLSFGVVEAGDDQGSATAGLATASGRMVTASNVRVTQVNLAQGAEDVAAGSTATGLTAKGVAGTYGHWTIGSDGSYRYALDNAKASTQALKAGEIQTDTLNFTDSTGALQKVVASVSGSNDRAAIDGLHSANLIQGASLASAKGTLTVTDPDSGEAAFQSPANLLGRYGSFSFNASTGDWGYVLDNSRAATQALRLGDSTSESLTVRSMDGTASQTITITVAGSNDAPAASSQYVSGKTVAWGQAMDNISVVSDFSDPDAGDTLSYSIVSGQIPGLSLGSDGRLTGMANTLGTFAVVVRATDASGQYHDNSYTVAVTDQTPPAASATISEAPRAYDRGAITGINADSFMMRFSESVDADVLQAAMAQGKIVLEGTDGAVHSLGTGAVFEAFTPSALVLTGFGNAADGSYTSLWNPASGGNTAVPSLASGFGLANPANFAVDNTTAIYQKTNTDGSVWYIWRQVGWSTFIVSQDSPVNADGSAREWYLSGTSNSSDPAVRTAVLGVAGWSAKSGALASGTDPWAGTTRIAAADIEPNGWGRTYMLALGSGNTAQAGDTLIIDKAFVKDTAGNFASSNVGFSLPSDITRPVVSASSPATLQGLAADGSAKTGPLAAGDRVRVTLTLAEAVTVSANTDPSVTLQLDSGSRQAVINRGLSFAGGASSSQTLVFDYVLQTGDSDALGGITLGAFSRNNSNVFDLAGNRMTAPSDLAEVGNTLTVQTSSSSSVTLATTSSIDKGIVAGAVSDTLTFKFSAPVDVDTLEAAVAQGLVKVKASDGTEHTLGAGARIESTYPQTITVAGFSTAADGSYTTLYDSSTKLNSGLPAFSGFSTNGSVLSADNNYPAYRHVDAQGQAWYLWRPAGWANYVLTPESATAESNGQSQPWWASDAGAGTGTASVPREGVLYAGNWYANSGELSSNQSMWRSKLGAMPSLEASGYAYSFTMALGEGHTVVQGDHIEIASAAVKDTAGLSPTGSLSINLPTDITRATFGQATVLGMAWDSTQGKYLETTADLVAGNQVHVKIAASEALGIYHTGGATASVTLQLDNGVTRQAYLDLNQLAYDSTNHRWVAAAGTPLTFVWTVEPGVVDASGGITVGAMSRNSTGMYDAGSNRPAAPSDVTEASNSLHIVDTTGPSLWIGYAAASTIVLQASEALDAVHLPGVDAFAVTVNGQTVSVSNVSAVPGNSKAVQLTLASPLTAGQTVQVSYTEPSTGNTLQDQAGNPAANMQNYVQTVSAAPAIQYAQANADQVELAGNTELHFTIKFSDVVSISGTPRLALHIQDDGANAGTTVYADYQPYSNVSGGQNTVEFVYRPATGVQGQMHVNGLDLNGGSITAYGSGGAVAANTTLNGSEFFTPYTWIYPEFFKNTSTASLSEGDSGNNLLAPWINDPASTPHALTSTTALGSLGGRDVLVLNLLLPASVTTAQAAAAYSLSYNVLTDGTRQVLVKNGMAVVDTCTVPATADWPNGVEQLLYIVQFKDASGAVQFTGIPNVLLTLQTAVYTDPVNASDHWLQGSLGNDTLSANAYATSDRVFLEGAQGNDTLLGHDGVDILRGGGGTNTLSAGAGNDTVIVGHSNADSVDGGAGNDTLRFDLPGNEKKITLDASGTVHVYSASGSWSNGSFVPDAQGWVERYSLSSADGSDGSNRLAVLDVALGRTAAYVKNIEQLQWRLNDNPGARATNTLTVGTSGDDTLNAGDVVLAGAGDDTIVLNPGTLHTYDWKNGNRPVLIDGGAGRDVLVLDGTNFYGYLNQVFEYNQGNDVSVSRAIKNIEGLSFTGAGFSTVTLSAADVINLYSAIDVNTNGWSEIINSTGKRQFKIDGAVGLNLTDTSGWTLQTNTVSYGGVTYKIADHSSGVELILDSRIGISGGLSSGGFSGGATVPDPTQPTTPSGTAPAVQLVRTDYTGTLIFPGDDIRLTAQMDQPVTVNGVPRIELLLKAVDGTSKTVYADFVPYSGVSSQTTLEFVYHYTEADVTGAGWQYHVQGTAIDLNGGAIVGSNGGVAASTTLSNVGLTALSWLYTSTLPGAIGTGSNDVLLTWDSDPSQTPTALAFNSASGGAGDRDVLSVPILLDGVTDQATANAHWLTYDVVGNGATATRSINVHNSTGATVKTLTVPSSAAGWPDGIEVLGYHLVYKDGSGVVHDNVDGSQSFILLYKTATVFTDPVDGNVVWQGSYVSDTMNASTQGWADTVRARIIGGPGNDTVTGHAGADYISGDGGNDSINAGAGDDRVIVGNGNDALIGGDGIDTLQFNLHGQQARAMVDGSDKLHLQSANGNWTNGQFVADSAGYSDDWVIDFYTGITHPGSNDVTMTSGFERIQLRFASNSQIETAGLVLGTSGDDTLQASAAGQGVLNGLDGNDTVLMDVAYDRPFLFGGNGDDVFVYASNTINTQHPYNIHGGAGADVIRLGSTVSGLNLDLLLASAGMSNSESAITSIEHYDITGGGSNTLRVAADALKAVSGGTLFVEGNAGDAVQLASNQGWAQSSNSDQLGYNLWSTSYSGEGLRLYVQQAINTSMI